jgi:hypothetical protein
MGKYILLITLSVSAALSMYAGQFQSAQVDARSELAERQKLIIARQMARSAYASGVSEVKRQLNVSLNQCEQLEGEPLNSPRVRCWETPFRSVQSADTGEMGAVVRSARSTPLAEKRR